MLIIYQFVRLHSKDSGKFAGALNQPDETLYGESYVVKTSNWRHRRDSQEKGVLRILRHRNELTAQVVEAS